MNKWQLIKDFSEANEIPLNANTRNQATHLAMACISAGMTEEETKKLAVASAKVFTEMAIDTPEDSPYREFSKDVYFATVMNVFVFLYTEAMFGESELVTRLTNELGEESNE
jgi:hypothetical protein